MTYAVSQGARIHFEEAGTGEPSFLLVHGNRCDLTTMAPLAEHLSRRGHVVSLDLRGHGLSDKPSGPYSGADFVADVIAVAAQAKMHRPVLVGHSMGAKVVLAVSRDHPSFPIGLVLLDNLVAESPDQIAARRAELTDDPGADEARRRRVERMFVTHDQRQLHESIMSRILGTPLSVQVAIQAASDEIDPAAALHQCQVPVLHIGAPLIREDPQLLVQLKPDILMARVVGAGHFVQLDAAAQVNAMIDRFVDVYLVGDTPSTPPDRLPQSTSARL